MIRFRKMESGFVLVMVLLALVICGTILAAAASRSARSAISAGAVQRDLQMRWGSLSCRDTILNEADELMAAAKDPASSELWFTPILGGMTFHLILADEQAKANVNSLARRDSYGLLESHLRRLQSDAREALIVRLRPLEGEDVDKKYSSFDQLFAISNPDAIFDATATSGPVARQRITCWGDGKINLRRAEIPVMREALAGNLTESQMNSLVKLRKDNPTFTMKEAFEKVELTKERIAALTSLVTTESNCYSLWISAESNGRRWRRLHVDEAQLHRMGMIHWSYSW